MAKFSNVIYCMKSKSTERILYVGQSRSFDNRMKEHLGKLRRGTHRTDLVAWVSDNGIDDIVFRILESCASVKELDFLEMKWFYSLNPMSYGKVPSLGTWEMTEDTRDKIRARARKRWPGPRTPKGDLGHYHVCSFCSINFLSRKTSQIYCSNSCRVDARKFVFDSEDMVVDMYVSGMSLRDIGAFFGTSRNTVSTLLKNNKVQLRKNTDQPKYSMDL